MIDAESASVAIAQKPPARACLEPLLNALGWTGGPRRLYEALPEDQSMSDFPALSDALENLRFRVVLQSSRADEFGEEVLPGLLVRDDGDIWVVVELEKHGYFKVFKGNQERLATVQADELTGRFYGVSPMENETVWKGRPRLGWFTAMLENEPGAMRTLLGSSLLINLAALALPVYVMLVFDIASGLQATTNLMLMLGGVAIISLEIILREWRARLIAAFGVQCQTRLIETAFERITSLPMAAIEKISGTGLNSRLKAFENIRSIFGSPLLADLLDLPFTVLFILAGFAIGGWLGWLIVGLAAILAGSFVVFALKMRLKVHRANIRHSETERLRTDMAANLPIIQCAGAEEIWEQLYGRLVSRGLAADADLRRSNAVEVTRLQVLAALTGVTIVGAGAFGAVGEELSLGASIALLVILWRIVAPVQSILLNINALFKALDVGRQLKKLMRLPHERSRQSAMPYDKISGQIELQSVTYREKGASLPLFQDISIDADRGELVAITGPRGQAGSTLLRVIANLYRPERGCVRIDGFDVTQFDARHLRQHIALVGDDQFLFPGSLTYNFKLANPFASEDLIHAAIKDADLEGFVDELEDGMETDLTDALRAGLSPNIYQKICLARAYVKSPAIYLFNEPMKTLDASGRRSFINKLFALKGSKTVLVSASDEEILHLADKVAYLEDGRLLKLSTHPPFDDGHAAKSLRSLLERSQIESKKRSASA